MTDDNPGEFRIRSLTTSVYIPSFVFATGMGAVAPIIPLLALDIGLSVSLAAALVVVQSLGTLLFDVPAGLIISRFGERKAMPTAAAVMAGASLGISVRPPVIVLFALVALIGAAWSIWQLARVTYVTAIIPEQQRGRVMSIVGGSNRVGRFFGPLLAGLLVAPFGLAAPFYLHAAFALAASLILLATASSIGGDTDKSSNSDNRRLGPVLKHRWETGRRLVVTAAGASLILMLLRAARDVILPLWGDSIAMSASEISLIFAVSGAAELTLIYGAGSLSDRLGRKWAVIPSISTLSLGLAIVPLTRGFVSLLVVGTVIGFGTGMGAGVLMTLGSDLAPQHAIAPFLGAWRLLGDVGGVLGPLVVSVMSAAAGLHAAALLLGATGAIGAVLTALKMPETLRRTQ